MKGQELEEGQYESQKDSRIGNFSNIIGNEQAWGIKRVPMQRVKQVSKYSNNHLNYTAKIL